MDDINI